MGFFFVFKTSHSSYSVIIRWHSSARVSLLLQSHVVRHRYLPWPHASHPFPHAGCPGTVANTSTSSLDTHLPCLELLLALLSCDLQPSTVNKDFGQG